MAKKRANGEGSVFYVKSRKHWKATFKIGTLPNGKPDIKAVYGKTQQEALSRLAQIKFDIHNGSFIDESQITIYQLAKQILDESFNLNYVKENTYYRNIETLKRLEAIYNTPLQKANETLIKNYLLSQQKYSQSTIDKEFILLKKVFREALKRKLIKSNPMEDIRKPKTKKKKEKTRALTIEEELRLLDALYAKDIQYSAQMLISLYTGMRIGEINALEVRDINFTFKRIYVNKTISRGQKGEALLSDTTKTDAGERSIIMLDEVVSLFKEIIGDRTEGYIFERAGGGLITTNQVNMQFQRALKKYDIVDASERGKVTAHSLRHTFATRAIESGMNAKILQKVLGHKDISITMNTYCDAFSKFEEQHTERLEEYFRRNGLTLSRSELIEKRA